MNTITSRDRFRIDRERFITKTNRCEAPARYLFSQPRDKQMLCIRNKWSVMAYSSNIMIMINHLAPRIKIIRAINNSGIISSMQLFTKVFQPMQGRNMTSLSNSISPICTVTSMPRSVSRLTCHFHLYLASTSRLRPSRCPSLLDLRFPSSLGPRTRSSALLSLPGITSGTRKAVELGISSATSAQRVSMRRVWRTM